jgi:hypothetical protein
MKFTLRLVSAIWLSVMLVIGVFAYMQIREERGRLLGDLQRRAVLISEGLTDAIEASAAKQSPAALERIVKKFGQSQRGIVVYDRFATQRFASPDVASILPPSLPEATEAISRNAPTQGFRTLGDRTRFIYVTPLVADDQPVGAIAVLQDASHLDRAEWDRWSYNAVRFLVLALVISVIIGLVVRSGAAGRSRRRAPSSTRTCSDRWRSRCRGSPAACSARKRRPSRRPRCAWPARASGPRSA